MKRIFLTRTMLVLAVSYSSMAASAQSKPARESSTRNYGVNENNGLSTIDYKADGKWYKIKMKDDKIIELYVDDKKIAEQDYSQYQDAVDKILSQVKKDKEKAEEGQKQAQNNQQLAKLESEKAAMNRQQAEQYVLQAQKQRQLAEVDQKKALDEMQQAKLSYKQSVTKKQQTEQYEVQTRKYKVQAEQDQERSTVAMKRMEKDKDRITIDEARATVDAKRAAEDKQAIESLLDDLVKEKIVNDREDVYSIELSEDSFSVNGKKQSDELQRKFKANHLKAGKKINFKTRQFSIEN